MKKNRLLSCLLLVVAVLAFTGCKKWLELKPLDGIVKEEFWKTKEQVKASVIGIYSSMMEYSSGSYSNANYVPSLAELLFVWGEGRADHVANATVSSADDIALINVNIQPTNVNANWRPFYRTINFCNTVIEKAPEVFANMAAMKSGQIPTPGLNSPQSNLSEVKRDFVDYISANEVSDQDVNFVGATLNFMANEQFKTELQQFNN